MAYDDECLSLQHKRRGNNEVAPKGVFPSLQSSLQYSFSFIQVFSFMLPFFIFPLSFFLHRERLFLTLLGLFSCITSVAFCRLQSFEMYSLEEKPNVNERTVKNSSSHGDEEEKTKFVTERKTLQVL